jgi:hypothetical protein
MASTLASAAPLLRLLTHEDLSGYTALDLTMSFWPTISAVVAPLMFLSVVVSRHSRSFLLFWCLCLQSPTWILCCLSLTTTLPFTIHHAIMLLLRLCLLHWPLSLYALSPWPPPPRALSSPNILPPSSSECWLPLFFLRWGAITSLSLILEPRTTCFWKRWPLSLTSWCQNFKFGLVIIPSFQLLAAVWL